MRILSIEFTYFWSWGLTVVELFSSLQSKFGHRIWRVLKLDKFHEKLLYADAILLQQVNISERIPPSCKHKTVCRMGSVRCFFGRGKEELATWHRHMSECRYLVATNNWLLEYGMKINKNTVLIPNGLDLKKWDKKKFTVGYCANVQSVDPEYKGYVEAIEACKKIEGVELKTALFRDNQIPHDKMKEEFYHRLDCIIHPTVSEGCSNTLMEACACGIAIVTTRTAGFHGELMVDGENVLFCEKTSSSIEACIRRLMVEDGLKDRLGKGARMFAEKYHDIDVIAEKYNELFKTIEVKK